MFIKGIIYVFLVSTALYATMIEKEIGIDIGVTSTKNSDGSKFNNPTFGLSYQDSSYIVSPRVDLEYVDVKKEQADAFFKASINGVYEYETKTNILPYALAGVGYEKVIGETKGVIESHPFIQGGAGIKIDIKDGYRAKIEGRFLQILGGKDENNEAILTAGLTIPLNYKKTIIKNVIKVVRRPVKPIVIKPIVRVERVERPPIKPIIIREPKKVIYSNSNECSIKISAPDLDRDGVEDRLDQCPNTPCNFSVDGYGCPIKATLQIHFTTNSSEIRDYSMVKVNQFADFLLKNRGSIVTIIGHTDSRGSAELNKSLSYRRANSVVQALIARGISPARIHAEGRGESTPIASNQTEEGRAKNRRIEAILSYPKRRR